MKVKILLFICLLSLLVSCASKFVEKEPLLVPPVFQEEYNNYTKSK